VPAFSFVWQIVCAAGNRGYCRLLPEAKESVDDSHSTLEIRARSSYVLSFIAAAFPASPARRAQLRGHAPGIANG
jgi:hypothetical protein